VAVPSEVIKIVQTSGNSFHAKVARWFQSQGWRVTVSPYYMDQTQGKAREIDLVAEKIWAIQGDYRRKEGEIGVRLFIECKFVPNYSVFWLADKDIAAAEGLVCAKGPFRRDNTYTKKHHYLERGQRVAKLFATAVGRSQETEPFCKALNQVLNATVSMQGQGISSALTQGHPPALVLEFPLVVCSSFGQMYQTDFYADATPELISDNFQLELNYAYVDRRGQQRDDYFLVDFVEFDRLKTFADAIDQDAKTAGFFKFCQRSPHWSHSRIGVLEPIQDRLIEPVGDRLMEPPCDRVMEPA
jgi:hypothetical protein